MNQLTVPSTTRVERKILRLIERDGPNCAWCRNPVVFKGQGTDRATLDHIVPRSVYASDHIDVLVLSCFRCNNLRGTLTINEFCELAPSPDLRIINAAIVRARTFIKERAGYYSRARMW